MQATRHLIPLLAVAALSGCGSGGPVALVGDEDQPTAGELVARSAEALLAQEDPSARFRLKAEAKPGGGGPAALIVGERVSVELEGAASGDALVAEGSVQAAGESFEGEIRAGDGFFIRVGDDWYGSPSGGPGGGPGDGVLDFTFAEGVERRELVAALRAADDGLVDGDVSAGPEVDGDATWQVEGTLDPDAVVAIGKQLGAPLPPDMEAALRQGAEDVQITYAAGRDDGLPRRIALRGALASADLPAGLADDVPLDGVSLDVELTLSDWGEEVEFEAPESYTSFSELIGRLLGEAAFGFEGPEGRDAPQSGLPAPSLPQPTPAPPPDAEVQVAPPPTVPPPALPDVPAEPPAGVRPAPR